MRRQHISKIFIFIGLICLTILVGFQRANWLSRASKPTLDTDGPGPARVFIEGGTFVMGNLQGQDITFTHDINRKNVTVTSFWMDEHEITNGDWMEYLNDLRQKYPGDEERIYYATPNTQVWLNPLTYNEPFVDLYLEHEGFQDYPVVGVSWEQAVAYCEWRSEAMSEAKQQGGDGGSGAIIQPFRLATEAEWEYAAISLTGQNINRDFEMINQGKIYPWNGMGVRAQDGKKSQGMLMANFKAAAGEYTGITGYRNDGHVVTAPVKSYWPNDFFLYDMGGNVNEWVDDIYHPLSHEDVNDFNPLRNEGFLEIQHDYRSFTRKPTWEQYQAMRSDSSALLQDDMMVSDSRWDGVSGLFGVTTLVNERSRVFKGGSWNDQAFWLQPATRRHMQQEESSATVGFRTVTTATGTTVQGRSVPQVRRGDRPIRVRN